MWKIKRNNEMDILKKTQENLEMTQINNQMLFDTFSNILNKDKTIQGKIPKTDEEKLQAAYALNLCTVSISQIIEYNDIRFMEKEYEAILNNLNLENMPKDEALLRILKQLLDVITFFRIQDGDKKMMEKEYEQKIKDAIWSAIPNPSTIVVGNPVATAISLASQIGTGYMNYRKEKAQINLDKARKEWELQRSAIEQFHGLRRELFDTAWRLADEYQFPDEYRITERQISQFNDILLDTDSLRRYERLDYIKENFKAYPPFWYYLGHAANEIYQDERYCIDFRHQYKNLAISYFYEFDRITKNNLMREDQLVASCALEKFDLIEDKKEQISLLEKAIKASGKALDVQQICAISYLKIGETDKVCELLKMLVNEDYNANTNAQLLSRIYVSQYINEKDKNKFQEHINNYKKLTTRFQFNEYLFPFPNIHPETETEKEQLNITFHSNLKSILIKNYCAALIAYTNKCEKEYNDILKHSENIPADIAKLILSMGDSIKNVFDEYNKIGFLSDVKKAIDAINKNNYFYKTSTDSNNYFRDLQNCSFKKIFEQAFTNVAKRIQLLLLSINQISDISNAESALQKFIIKNELKINNFGNCTTYKSLYSTSPIEQVFDDIYKENIEICQIVEKCLTLLQNEKYADDSLIKDSEKVSFLKRGEVKFNSCIDKKNSIIKLLIKPEAIFAILSNKSNSDKDLLFTTEGIIVISRHSIKYYSSYENIYSKNSYTELIINGHKFNNKHIHMDKLCEMMDELKTLLTKNNIDDFDDLQKDIIKTFYPQKNELTEYNVN